MNGAYDPSFDYRTPGSCEASEPMLTLAQAAPVLGLKSREGVRNLVNLGRLPARRRPGYHGRIEVPLWAVEGLRLHRGNGPVAPPATTHYERGSTERERHLEDTVAMLLDAREHEARALQLQQEVATELAAANRALSQAVTNALVVDVASDHARKGAQ